MSWVGTERSTGGFTMCASAPASLLLILLLVAAGGLSPANAVAQENELPQAGFFAATWVHGKGVDTPFLIEDEAVAMCLWRLTYNFYDTSEDPAATGPEVTLSFFTRDDWTSRVNPDNPIAAQLNLSRFHTRIHQTEAGTQPYVEFRKGPGIGRFRQRGRISALGEHYLGSHGIPTRRDDEGNPAIRQLRGQELSTSEAQLAGVVPCAVPG